ncbi:MAG: class I SAM-dependent methyltransferase family protein [Candidatus Omnitrophota bacterium]|nr:class I SAM-dependent methyltransferase family protein [Candidatus Omnitrophota bacterium]MDZ4242339.1 class I SAM-dependent methyltransferase family protein [Candidatus Omnitrophota bacterium]
MALKLIYPLARIFMKTVGQTSDGIRMCYQYGLTSGKMLDYIYKNKPSGRWGIGKALDRAFLNHVGWEAIRIRRRHLEQLMTQSVDDLRQQKRPISLLDIASGPGAYVLAVMAQAGEADITARCRDFDGRWADEGREAAKQAGLNNVVFEQGDAYDRAALQAVQPRPNLMVSSGFYDWFNEDEKVKESIRIVHDVLDPGGYFVMTNQAAHPNLEFTQEVFTDFNNNPLRMAMRPPSLICKWLEETGFIIEHLLADQNGYYTAIKARKK